MSSSPPDVVIVIDADTVVAPGSIEALARAAVVRPAQAVNLLHAPEGAGPSIRISAFAFLLKNMVRPRGMDRMGLPCLLHGTGMALPWHALEGINLAHGDITEDIRLGVELASRGYPSVFCSDAEVSGEFPADVGAAASQRRRWEHGHLRTLTRQVPRLIRAGVTRQRFSLLALALHLGVPPLALLFLLGFIGVLSLWLVQLHGAALGLAVTMGLAIVAILLAWARFGRACLPGRELLFLPYYVARKVPLYLAYLFRPQREWVRTKREDG
jgi:cellulose synthase/poly-beta-1,6-N-acetylglucosamine synthase-like glycosyltransferase